MVRDRLAEFRWRAGIRELEVDNVLRGNARLSSFTPTSIPLASLVSGYIPRENERLENELLYFFNQVLDIKVLIEYLKSDVEKVKFLHSTILTTALPDSRQKNELDELMNTVKTGSQVLRHKLKDMERENMKAEAKENESVVMIRIRKTQHTAWLLIFLDIMHEYQTAQTKYMERWKNRIKRQILITGSKFSEDEVEELIDEGNYSVFTQGIMIETEQARQMLADVEARHNDIIKLENSLRELHDLFLEMAQLVEIQGEVVDRIETNVEAAQEYVDKAQENLKQAEILQAKVRKKQIFIGIVVILVILLFALIIISIVYYTLPDFS